MGYNVFIHSNVQCSPGGPMKGVSVRKSLLALRLESLQQTLFGANDLGGFRIDESS